MADDDESPTPADAPSRRDDQNAQFELYYRAQLASLLPTDRDWGAFIASLRSPLPITFRFAGAPDGAVVAARRARFEEHVLPAIDRAYAPHPLAFYPARAAWGCAVSRAALRGKGEPGGPASTAADGGGGVADRGAMRALHEWLLCETAVGHVQRQEAASMVPVLVLGAKRGMAVLDLCASPGSKTQQLLEILDAPERDAAGTGPGFVVANDADLQRCRLLVAQARRLHSTRLIATHHDGRMVPEAGLPRFDRVLCDVPCSGDGTLRKAPMLWRRWTAATANALHRLQLQLACKGVRMLRVGGSLVYSTCSLNPARARRRCCCCRRWRCPCCARGTRGVHVADRERGGGRRAAAHIRRGHARARRNLGRSPPRPHTSRRPAHVARAPPRPVA